METKLIKKDGKVSMERSLDFLCSLLPNGEYILSIKRKTQRRTLSQNALMWLWFACMEESTGQLKEDIHDYYCLKFLPRYMTIENRQVAVPGKTSQLNTQQFTTFLEKVKADAATEFGIMLPLPGDAMYQPFVDHYQSR